MGCEWSVGLHSIQKEKLCLLCRCFIQWDLDSVPEVMEERKKQLFQQKAYTKVLCKPNSSGMKISYEQLCCKHWLITLLRLQIQSLVKNVHYVCVLAVIIVCISTPKIDFSCANKVPLQKHNLKMVSLTKCGSFIERGAGGGSQNHRIDGCSEYEPMTGDRLFYEASQCSTKSVVKV